MKSTHGLVVPVGDQPTSETRADRGPLDRGPKSRTPRERRRMQPERALLAAADRPLSTLETPSPHLFAMDRKSHGSILAARLLLRPPATTTTPSSSARRRPY